MIAPITLAACLALHPGSVNILARDLAPAWPALGALEPETPLAFAPVPGVPRVLRLFELRELAARWHLSPFTGSQICVARPVKQLDTGRLLEAMRRTLPDAAIEILDCSRRPAPEGSLEFPRSALRREAGAGLWGGWVTYAPDRRFHIWARVRVTVSVTRVLAVGGLSAGHPISASQVLQLVRREYPSGEPFAQSAAEVIGRCPRRPIRAGAAIRTDELVEPKAVAIGDAVEVEVRSGGALLRLRCKAEAAGSVGAVITVNNPSSPRLMRARVTAPGKAVLDVARSAAFAPPPNQESHP